MYPNLDQAIHRTITNSTKTQLSTITTAYYGDPQLQNTSFSIAIAHTADNLNTETFSSDDRVQAYVLKIRIKKLKYLPAMQLLRDIIQEIKEELHLSTYLSEYNDYMTIGDIVPIYDDRGVLREADMQLLFNVEEDYTPAVATFDDLNIRGDFDNED